MRIIDLISIPAVAALLAACGGGDDGGDTQQPATIDPCELVTQPDAEAVFGYPASPDEEGADVVDPAYLGECLWTYEFPDYSSLLLAIYVWDNSNGLYYTADADSEPLDIGEEGYIKVDDLTGVDIGWRQDGVAIYLDYFTTGPSAPDATDKLEEVKAVALEASARM